MKAKISRWGNSLALRITHAVAEEAGLTAGMDVELTLDNGKLVIQSTRLPLQLDEMLKRVTAENIHGEWDIGPPIGRES